MINFLTLLYLHFAILTPNFGPWTIMEVLGTFLLAIESQAAVLRTLGLLT